jgi:predicted nucleic acid-binding protein
MHSTFTAFFDANVFFGARLRSFIMELSYSGVFRARWSPDIHREWIAAVVRRRTDLTPEQLYPIRDMMDEAIPDALIDGYGSLIDALKLPDPNDSHVLAAAIVGRADVIVTFNEADFPKEILEPYRIHTRHPDAFFLEAEGVDPGVLTEAAARDLAHYKRPPLTIAQYVDDLRRAGVPHLADYLFRMRVLLADAAERAASSTVG